MSLSNVYLSTYIILRISFFYQKKGGGIFACYPRLVFCSCKHTSLQDYFTHLRDKQNLAYTRKAKR